MKSILVKREIFISKKTNKECFNYFVEGNVRGVDVKIGLVPPDLGGYTVLDIVFNGEMECDLIVTPFEITDDIGKVISGNTFVVRSIGEDGEVYECKVKPARNSDKDMLNMLISQAK